MSFKFPKIKFNIDGLIGSTINNNFYKSQTFHNKTSKANCHKSKWIIQQKGQFEVFIIQKNL